MTVSRAISLPPHELTLVIDFVNTLDVSTGEDTIAEPGALASWLSDRDLLDADVRALGAAQMTDAQTLREALRAVMLAHVAGPATAPPPGAGAALDRVAARGRLSVCIGADGAVAIAPRATGFAGALARLLAPVALAALDGSWQRVKVCDAGDCREAFYDRSRNRSGRWCDMAVCGNRTKVRTHRARTTG